MHVDADVVVCSSSGWAHGVAAEGRRIVYCHAPARWLYQRETYLRELGPGARAAQRVLQGPLERWDRRAAASAERYVVNSSHIARSIRELYDRDAEVLPPPSLLSETDERRSVAVPGTGFMLCVSRLLSYKNVDAIVAAFRELPRERLVVVGSGPDQLRLEALAGGNVTLLHGVDDAQLRWLYANAVALVAASYEDFGLTPLEAATFGKPTIALHFGGFLDTVVEGRTGHFFDQPEPNEVASAIRDALRGTWDAEEIKAHAARFSQPRFVNRLRAIVAEAAS
jgi:glycosyltransferase involved in cell wall biosynthesis